MVVARRILGADIERQIARLAAVGDQLLRRVEVALAQAVVFEDVAPAARADGEIHC